MLLALSGGPEFEEIQHVLEQKEPVDAVLQIIQPTNYHSSV